MSIDGKEQRWVLNEKIRTTEKEFGWHTWLDKIGFNASGTKDIKDIFGDKIFDTPKPVSLIQWLVNLVADKDSIILDSFAGSGTTGRAVLKQNAEDGVNRRFILIEWTKI